MIKQGGLMRVWKYLLSGHEMGVTYLLMMNIINNGLVLNLEIMKLYQL